MSRIKDLSLLKEEVIHLRREFHQYPELGFKEYGTAKRVATYLKECNLDVKTGIARTGVTAYLKGGREGKTLLLRADMDALPLTEETGLPFSSKLEGRMHACGHDGHMAMLLVAAKALSSMREELRGSILFVFQPNEEKEGAKYMIEEGILNGVDGAMACHLWSPLPSGEIGISAGVVMGGLYEFVLTIKGKGGHTAAPHEARDPIMGAASIIKETQLMQCREVDPLRPIVIVFGRIHGGTTTNIIPNEVQLEGTIRYLYDTGETNAIEDSFERLISSICNTHRLEYDLEYIASSPPLYNHRDMVHLLQSLAQEEVGVESIREVRSLAGEDFAEFSSRVPSLFYFLGCGNKEKGCIYPHHHPCFDLDEDVLMTGVRFHVFGALQYLNHYQV